MSEEVNVLSPHWREVATHVVAFTGAVLLLRRFAWKPLLGVLEDRRERIVSEFEGIERGKGANEKLRIQYEQQLRTIDAQARSRLQEAVSEGQKVAAEIKEQARSESRDLMQRAQEEIEREKDKAEVALKEDMVGMAMVAAEKVIRQKLDPATHKKLISDAIEEMTRMRAT
jgi:F-type H+-transporting ATPase subunit b